VHRTVSGDPISSLQALVGLRIVPEKRTAHARTKLSNHIYIITFGMGSNHLLSQHSECTKDCLWDPISSLASIGGLRIVPGREQLCADKSSINQYYSLSRCGICEQSSTTQHSSSALKLSGDHSSLASIGGA
jgi:hypothetical protein